MDINNELNNDNFSFFDIINNIKSPFTLTAKHKKKFLTILEKNNFTLNTSNLHLLEYSDLFLIASLKNNYIDTINALYEIKDIKTLHYDIKNYNELANILIENDFVCENDCPTLLLTVPYAFVASLYVDSITTLANYQYSSNALSKEERKYIYEKGLRENDIPPSYLNEPFIYDDYIMKKYIPNNIELDFVKNILLDPNVDYCCEDELILLKFLNSPYKTIEEEIRNMHEKGIDRYHMSITQILAFAFYARKYLYENNVKNHSVNMFNYSSNDSLKGLHTNDSVFVFVDPFPANGTVKNILLTLNHELEHAIQQSNFIKVNLDKDEDIDIYTKDYFLKTAIGKEYIIENYHTLSYEIDAQIKSEINTSIILGESVLDAETLTDVVIPSPTVVESLKIANSSHRKYKHKDYSMDKMMDFALALFLQNNPCNRFTIAHVFTTIGYDYELDDGNPRKKDIKDLIDSLDTETDKKKRTIYAKLISRRISSIHDDTFASNLNIVIDSLKENYNKETKIILSKILYNEHNKQASQNLKYIKFALDNINKYKHQK